jgi:hypothetical protein
MIGIWKQEKQSVYQQLVFQIWLQSSQVIKQAEDKKKD